MHVRRLACSLALLTSLSAVPACSKPAPPQIVPKEAKVTGLGPVGVDFVIVVEATNPNTVTLSAQSVTASAKLDGKWDLGTVKIDKPISLPSNVPTAIEVPLTMPWTDVKALAVLATTQKPVSYVVSGTMAVGGERLNVDVPFSLSGTISKDQLTAAANKSLGAIPGLGGLKLP